MKGINWTVLIVTTIAGAILWRLADRAMDRVGL